MVNQGSEIVYDTVMDGILYKMNKFAVEGKELPTLNLDLVKAFTVEEIKARFLSANQP